MRSVPKEEDPSDDSEAWIIAKDIENQFRDDAIERLRPLVSAVLEFAACVQGNLRRFGDAEDQRRVGDAWRELTDHVHSIAG